MLDSMRKSATESVALRVVFGVIVLVFIFWGIGTVGFDQMQVAARVNDEVITTTAFERTYRNLADSYRDLAPGAIPEERIRGQALDQLITTELLLQEATRLDLEVGAIELRDSIAAIPAFQQDGRFSKDLYVRTLQANGLKPADFEDLQRQQLLANKLRDIVLAGVHVGEDEVRERYRWENERVSLRFVSVPASRFVEQVTVDEEGLKAFYEAEKERFREPERASVRYLALGTDFFRAKIEPTEEEILAYYDQHSEEYRRPEEVRARSILFKRPAEANEEALAALRRKAGDVLARAKAGEDFAALARQHSEDSTASEGGDLGFFGRGVLEGPVEDAAFALEPGSVSDIVETASGFYVLKVEEKRPERVEPLETVRAGVVEAVRGQRARRFTLERAEQAHEKLLDGATLDSVAAELGLTVETPAPFSRSEGIAGLGTAPEILDAVFETGAGTVGEIVTLDDGYVLFQMKEITPSHVPELATIRAQVETALREKRAGEAARRHAEDLHTKLKAESPPDLAALAAAEGLTVEDTGPVGRIGPYVPQIGVSQQLKDDAFRLTPEAPLAPSVYDAGTGAVIALLAERLPADESRFEEGRQALTDRLRGQAQAATFERFVKQLRAQARVEIGQGFADRGGGLS